MLQDLSDGAGGELGLARGGQAAGLARDGSELGPKNMTFAATLLTPRVGLVQDLPDLVDAADQLTPLHLHFHLRKEDPLTTIQQ